MNRIQLTLICFVFPFILSSQILKGKIISNDGLPVSSATIYISEIMSGIVTDDNGNFQLKINAGKYHMEVRSLGYETIYKTISITSESNEVEIVLPVKILQLKELTVNPSKEDPAYMVMRHAIAKAPFHLYQVSEFTSENYIKGSAKIESIPLLMKKMLHNNDLNSLIGKLLIMESQNDISYVSPNKYNQKVIAYKSSIPKEIEPKGGIRTQTSNIYDDEFMDKISPLSISAFQYYKFKLEEIYPVNSSQINKIRVTPRLDNDKLFSGYLYIIDGLWSVSSINLTASDMGTATSYRIDYQEVKPTVFLPISYEMNVNIGTMGVKGYARFISSVKYKSIKLNGTINNAHNQQSPKKEQSISSANNITLNKIKSISSKDKLSNRDAIKLSKLLKKSVEPDVVKKERESLEINQEELVILDIDTLADKRDSVFWDNIRKVPLLADEIVSFQQKDSLNLSKSISTTNNSIEIKLGSKNHSLNWLNGGNIKIGKSTSLFYDGLLKGMLNEFNFVDGFWLGQKVNLSISTSKTTSLSISPSVYYTTARNSLVWNVNNTFKYAPFLNGQLRIKFGNSSEDIQHEIGTSRLFNSISSLFFANNVSRLFQKKYLYLENKLDIANGLVLTTGVSSENRKLLGNNTSFHFFGSSPQPNYPDVAYLNSFPTNISTYGWAKIEFTPKYKYQLSGKRKEYVSSVFPTFSLDYTKAIPLFSQQEQSSFDRFCFSIHQDVNISVFDKVNYKVAYGKYLSSDKLYAPDYYYFATSPLIVSDKTFNTSFNLLDNYTFSTTEWMEANINWNSKYLLLKRIKFLQNQLFDESVHFHTLINGQNNKSYSEIGYSIGFSNLGRIGVFSSFDGLVYKNTGIKISLPIFKQSH